MQAHFHEEVIAKAKGSLFSSKIQKAWSLANATGEK